MGRAGRLLPRGVEALNEPASLPTTNQSSASSAGAAARVGGVVIGRNEGDRLHGCLRSAVHQVPLLVYVDSGSIDGSVAFARSLGVDVVELDTSDPFTAARARNAGFSRLLELAPSVEFVQFVDGDCELIDGWITWGVAELDARPGLAVVVGRVRERDPDASIYNRLCDLEWNRPPGESPACGGIALVRGSAFSQVNGFRSDIVAGEEPELCLRLRQRGWKILRIDAEMALHNADMRRFEQWWRRARRAGHAYAEHAWLHWPDGHAVRPALSILLWAACLPAAVLATAWPTSGLSTVALLIYLLQWYRIRQMETKRGRPASDATLVATFILFGKFAQFQGLSQFVFRRLIGRRPSLIEHKHPVEARATCRETSSGM